MYIYTKYIYSKSYVFAKNGILSYGYPMRIVRLSYDLISTLYGKTYETHSRLPIVLPRI